MTDALISWDHAVMAGDLTLSNNDIETHEGLETAILLSLFTDRGGWWGDPVLGSRLYLLARSKREQSVLSQAVDYAVEALSWLVEDRVASSVNVSAEFIPGGFGIAVDVTRPTGDVATYKFNRTWLAQEARQ